MDVLIVHYHLNPGGVTKIIEAQIKALKATGSVNEILVLCGNSNDKNTLSGAVVKENPMLDYHLPFPLLQEQKNSLSAIMALITENVGASSVLHFHNPNLGKNPLITAAVYQLAASGIAVVNHCHDFAEDRPANMTLLEETVPALTGTAISEVLYPNFPWYHFIVLNSCDYQRIVKQGISETRVHLLQNPVMPQFDKSPVITASQKESLLRNLELEPGKLLCTYPVRAIRRKNLGEFILFAVIFSEIANFVVTLPPRNPEEIIYYNRWKAFCRENGIDVKFEAGEVVDYNELLIISDFCITTSIREGFGMVFLEPWLLGTPVIGRSLSCVIQDLRNSGLEFPRLYDEIVVDESQTDFKDLDLINQESFILNVMTNAGDRQKLLNSNHFIKSFLDKISDEIITKNKHTVLEKFSVNQYGKELLGIYNEISR